MQQKHILYLIPVVLIIGLGSYWLWKKNQTPTHYFSANASQLSRENTDYRKVLYTTEKSQLTLMSIPTGDTIPTETHTADQLFVIVEGDATALVDGAQVDLTTESILIVPAGTEHTISNTGTTDLKLYTLYTPPQHVADTIHTTEENEPKNQ